jgi:flagellar protein FliS
METSVHDEYFTMQVLTAPPPKLHLMLIEAAIRAAQHAQATWHDEDRGLACEALLRAQECVAQILAGLNLQAGDLAHKLAGLYAFVLRRLRDANIHRDRQALDEAMKILTMERETWQKVCQQTAEPKAPVSASEAEALNPPHLSFQA